MKKLLALVFASIVYGQSLVQTSYKYGELPEQWAGKEMIPYTVKNPIFASEDVFFHLLAKHYLSKDISDYDLARYLAVYLPEFKEFRSITD